MRRHNARETKPHAVWRPVETGDHQLLIPTVFYRSEKRLPKLTPMPTLLETRLTNRFRVQPNNANSYGTVHGGSVMQWLDEVGAMAAMRFAGASCVTAHMGGIDFDRPVPTGDIVRIETYVYEAGETSVTTHLAADRENPRTSERTPLTRSRAVYVALNDDGDPTSVPELTVETDEGARLRQAATDA